MTGGHSISGVILFRDTGTNLVIYIYIYIAHNTGKHIHVVRVARIMRVAQYSMAT